MRNNFIFELLKLLGMLVITIFWGSSISEDNKDTFSVIGLIIVYFSFELIILLRNVLWPLKFEFDLLSNNGSSPHSTHIDEKNNDNEKIIKLNVSLIYSNALTRGWILKLLNKVNVKINISPTHEKIYIRGDKFDKIAVVNNGVAIDITSVVEDIIKMENTKQQSALGYTLYVRTKPLNELNHVKLNIKCNLQYSAKDNKKLYFKRYFMKTSIKKNETPHEIIYFKGDIT